MITTLIKLSFRRLARKKTNTAISVIGLGIGIAATLLVAAYISNDYTYDRFHSGFKNIYRIVNSSRNTSQLNKEYYNSLVTAVPGIRQVCRVEIYPSVLQNGNTQISTDGLVKADSSFFKMFSFKLLAGSPEDVLNGPDKIVLTRSLASKLFHDTPALGKQVKIEMKVNCTVTGIMEDSPANSSIQPEAVVSTYTKDLPWSGGDFWNNSGKFHIEMSHFFLLLGNSGDTTPARKFLRTSYSEPWNDRDPAAKLTLQPLSELYSVTGIAEPVSFLHVNMKLRYLLITIGAIVLVLAIINTFNILLSESLDETKRASILKSAGASRGDVIRQSFASIALVILMSYIFAFIILDSALPWFNGEVERSLGLSNFIALPYLLFVAGTFIFLTVGIGIYPAFYFARSNPLELIRGSGYTNSSFRLISRVTLIFQFIISIVLISSVMIIGKQSEFVRSYHLGYNTENLLFVPIHYTYSNKCLTVKQELTKIPGIVRASASFGSPENIYLQNESKVNDKNMSYWSLNCDEDFFATMEIKLKQGRFFLQGEEGKACVVNEKFFKDAGFTSLDEAKMGDLPVVGIVENFNTESLHMEIKPGVMYFDCSNLTTLNLRISGKDIKGTLSEIRKVCQNVMPGFNIESTFYNDLIDKQYTKERNLERTIGITSAIALLISCLGLFSMILFVIRCRTKEIGIRKINGATTPEILILLNKGIIRWIAIAFALSLPVAYYLMRNWLSNFAFKTTLDLWIFLVAGLAVLLIAILTVSWQSWVAASLNPVKTLRYE